MGFFFKLNSRSLNFPQRSCGVWSFRCRKVSKKSRALRLIKKPPTVTKGGNADAGGIRGAQVAAGDAAARKRKAGERVGGEGGGEEDDDSVDEVSGTCVFFFC